MPNLKSQLESILFVASKPLDLKTLVGILNRPEDEVRAALAELAKSHSESGIILLEANDQYQLSTSSENSTIVKNYLNSDLREKLTDATVEVLAIVAYRQPISKSEIEAIRGVNSQYSIRHLLMRGLVEKIPNPNDARSNFYRVTTEFLQHLGLASISDLPEFEQLVNQIKLPQAPRLEEGSAESAAPTPKEEAS